MFHDELEVWGSLDSHGNLRQRLEICIRKTWLRVLDPSAIQTQPRDGK
jgi:hypothetical protein